MENYSKGGQSWRKRQDLEKFDGWRNRLRQPGSYRTPETGKGFLADTSSGSTPVTVVFQLSPTTLDPKVQSCELPPTLQTQASLQQFCESLTIQMMNGNVASFGELNPSPLPHHSNGAFGARAYHPVPVHVRLQILPLCIILSKCTNCDHLTKVLVNRYNKLHIWLNWKHCHES